MMRHHPARAALLALASLLLAAAPPLAAQEPGAARPSADSTAHRLTPVTVLAHARGRATARGNRLLERELIAYNRRIAQLEDSLHYLKTVVTDSLNREIETLSGAALATRARRLKLEERLRAAGAAAPAKADSAAAPKAIAAPPR